MTIQKNEDFTLSVYINLQYQNLTFNSSFKKQNEFMKQLLKMIILKFKTTILTNEKTNEAHRMHNTKMKIFITLKFSSSNKTQNENLIIFQ